MTRLLTVLTIAALGFAQLAAAQSPLYRLRPGDRIDVTVIEDPSLNRTVLVRPDGRIAFPLAGTIEAAGESPEAVAAAIRRALANQFVQPPAVTVSLSGLAEEGDAIPEDGEAARIYVIGEVARPGALDVVLPIDALRALALAGGPGTFAARKRIQIRRRTPDGAETVFLFDYDTLERGGIPSEDIALAPEDVIVVPERRLFE